MPLRVGQKSERSTPKPFSTEWILAPPEEAPVRQPPELPGWIPSERKMLALFIIVLSVIISIGGSSGGQPQAPAENRPLVQAPVPVTATVGIGGLQPNGPRGTEPQPPPRPTTTEGENAAPTQQP